MGNEMGNSNTSGLKQEQDNTGVDTENKYFEVPAASINVVVKGGTQLVSVVEGNDVHETRIGLASEDSSGSGEPVGDKKTSDGTEQERAEIQLPEESSKVSLEHSDPNHGESETASGYVNYHEKQTDLEENLSRTSEHQIQKQMKIAGGEPGGDKETSDGTEQDKTEIQLPEESSKVPTAHSDPNHEESDSASGYVNYHEQHIDLEENLSRTSEHQIPKQMQIAGDEEIKKISSPDPKSTSYDPDSVKPIDSKYDDKQEITETHTKRIDEGRRGMEESSEEILGLNEHHEEKKEENLEAEIDNAPGSVVSSINLETTKNVDDLPNKEMASQEKELPEFSNLEEKLESSYEVDIGNDLFTTTKTINLSSAIKNKGDSEQPPANLNLGMNDSLDSFQQEVFNPEDKYLVLTDDTEVIGDGSEIDHNKNDSNQTSLSKESGEESKTDEMNTSQFGIMMVATTDHEEKRMKNKLDDLCSSEKDFQIEQADMSVNGSQVDVHDSNLSFISEKSHEDLEGEKKSIAEFQTDAEGLMFINGNHEGEELTISSSSLPDPTEKNAIEEMTENTEDLDTMGKDIEAETENPIETSENLLPPYPQFPVQSQDSIQDTVMGPDTTENTGCSIVEFDQDSLSELVVTNASDFDSINSTMETVVLAELGEEKSEQDSPVSLESETAENTGSSIVESDQHNVSKLVVTNASEFYAINSTMDTVFLAELEEEKFDQEPPVAFDTFHTSIGCLKDQESIHDVDSNSRSEATEKSENFYSISELSSYDSEAEDYVARFSMDSNPENLNIHVDVSEPASFDFELPPESRTEESDQTPLLYQEKATSKSLSNWINVSVENSVSETKASETGQVNFPLQYQEMAVENKVVKLERSDSTKLRSPFLNFLKEEQETYVVQTPQREETYVVKTPQKQDSIVTTKKEVEFLVESPSNEVKVTSQRSKEKRKHRASIFSNCMCCTTVIH